MGELDDILGVVGRLYVAAAEPPAWDSAFGAVMGLVGGHGASIEVTDLTTGQHSVALSRGLSAVDEYLLHYLAFSPRIAFGARHPQGFIYHEGMFLEEAELERNPFYMEFLPGFDMRYLLAGVVSRTPTEIVFTATQRSARAGLPDEREVRLLRTLLPHIGLAFDLMRRLHGAETAAEGTGAALDWVADGVVVLDAQGGVLHANRQARAVARRNDGVALRRGMLSFASAAAERALQRALSALAAVAADPLLPPAPVDFVARRAGDQAPYAISVRPYSAAGRGAAVVFIVDPLVEHGASAELLRQVFGLTGAEADLAEALRRGTPLDAYAAARGLSVNTVYTHLRRIKDKTGKSRTVELIHALNAIRAAAAPLAR